MSILPSDTPKLPKWIFLAGDAALLATAFFIGWGATRPLSSAAMIAICACVALGVILGAIPFIADYARKQDEALDERQRALETLSRTVATSSEQIGIATNGLNELLDLTHKQVKQAEQLPHKLQEKIAEFQQQLTAANDEEKEELERELATLRSSDSERLEATADKIHKAAAEWAKLEAATAKHLSATSEALAKLPGAADAAAAKAAAELTKAIAAAQTTHAKTIDTKLAAALAEIDTHLAKSAGQLTTRATEAAGTFDAKIAALEAAIAKLSSAATNLGTAAIAPAAVAATVETVAQPATLDAAESSPASEPAAATTAEVTAPKRARKSRREDSTAEAAATFPVGETVTVAAASSAAPETAPVVTPLAEPPPAPAAATANIEPPPTVAPAPADNHPPSAIHDPQSDAPARKRAAKKSLESDQPALAIATEEPAASDSSEFSQMAPEEAHATTAVSADGATRLLVTAYVGIGNRLFVRGDGPGLSWEKGVPLQFVSIGKWRWETADAAARIRAKLFKNDQVECAALGEIALDPGHQAEVTANF